MNKEILVRAINKAAFKIKVKSPELLLIGGVVLVTAGAFLACKASTKVEDVIDDIATEKEDIKAEIEEREYPKAKASKELTKFYAHSALKIGKLYALPAGLFASGVGMIFASHGILKGRNAALIAAYNSLDTAFKEYKDYIKDKYGDEALDALIPGEKTSVKDIDTGEEKEVKVFDNSFDPNKYSPYARFFDETNELWEKDPTHNLSYLKLQQSIANNNLKTKGYVFLSDVYRALKIPETKESRVVGWLDDGRGDGYIDFNIYNGYRAATRDFVNGYENAILLDFNVDGVIIDDFERVGRLKC